MIGRRLCRAKRTTRLWVIVQDTSLGKAGVFRNFMI